jgi:hypothetical protein
MREPSWVTIQRLAAALGVDCRQFEDPNLAVLKELPEGRPRGRPPKATLATSSARNLEDADQKVRRPPRQPRKSQ